MARRRKFDDCQLKGCDKGHFARGFCKHHYHQLLITGSPLGMVRQPLASDIPCSIDWCDLPGKSNGLCSVHLQRKRNGTDMNMPIVHKTKVVKDADGRTCTKCNTYKPYSEFYWHSSGQGHQSRCKECYKERAAEIYARKKEKAGVK